MRALDPKIIHLSKPSGDFYEGIVLEHHPSTHRVKLYVTMSNIDSLSGVTKKGDIVDFCIDGWRLPGEAKEATIPGGFTTF